MTTAVLFDFGGTLDSDGLTWLDRFYAIYKEAGVDAAPERFSQAFYDSDDHLPQRHALKGLSLEQTLRLQVEDVLAVLAPERRDLTEDIAGRFLRDCRAHFNRNRPLLERLARRYRLGVVSNFYGNLDGVLSSEGLLPFFSCVADSGVVGRLKPEPGIFLHAVERLGAEASSCVMVGDSIPRDMRGAEGLAMGHALLSARDAVCCPSGWRLKALTDLEDYL